MVRRFLAAALGAAFASSSPAFPRPEQAYSGNAVCAPSRSVLMTGLHPGHTPIRDNREVQPEGPAPLPAATITLAELFKQQGYVTAAMGKWGLGPPGSEGGRLNIVSIVTDDPASWSVGAYGNPDARTPVLDRLARDGVLFRNAFVTTPVCSPSRAGFLTGRYGTELGIRDWISPETRNLCRNDAARTVRAELEARLVEWRSGLATPRRPRPARDEESLE